MIFTETELERLKTLLKLKAKYVFNTHPKKDMMVAAFELIVDHTKNTEDFMQINAELDKYEEQKTVTQ